MRIVALDPHPDRRRGGQERSLFDILVGLAERGHEVRLAYVKEGDFIPEYEQRGICCQQVERTWVERKASLGEWKALWRSVRSPLFSGVDIVYANQYSDVPLACMAARRNCARVVCHLRLPPMAYGFQHRIWMRQIDRYIVANANMKEKHVAAGWATDRITIVPNGFHFPDQEPEWPRELGKPLRMVYLGRISEEKGADASLDTLAGLVAQGELAELDVIGPTLRPEHVECKAAMQARIDHEQLPARILPPVIDPLTALQAYDICLFPSRWDEPFGRVLIESIMAGTPVIAREVGAVADIMGPPGRPWLFTDTEDALDRVLALIGCPAAYPLRDLYDHMQERFSWQVVLPEIERILVS